MSLPKVKVADLSEQRQGCLTVTLVPLRGSKLRMIASPLGRRLANATKIAPT
ncbi:MAG: hypothetical protein PUP92_04850 [Rhizonema sp. PD38]|nr:hypothetical protein [Rhizonema sp. PD38]